MTRGGMNRSSFFQSVKGFSVCFLSLSLCQVTGLLRKLRNGTTNTMPRDTPTVSGSQPLKAILHLKSRLTCERFGPR